MRVRLRPKAAFGADPQPQASSSSSLPMIGRNTNCVAQPLQSDEAKAAFIGILKGIKERPIHLYPIVGDTFFCGLCIPHSALVKMCRGK
jgi:hypothetical protein